MFCTDNTANIDGQKALLHVPQMTTCMHVGGRPAAFGGAHRRGRLLQTVGTTLPAALSCFLIGAG